MRCYFGASALSILVAVSSALFLPCSQAIAAEWTIMIYMNGKNNLERDALSNFADIAKIGSTGDVNLVVEMGRPKSHFFEGDDSPWSGVLRFYVKPGTKPVRSAALMDLNQVGEQTDMGLPETLEKFIDWSIEKYPANKYMLVIWNHGQGWRFQVAANLALRSIAANQAQIKLSAQSISFDKFSPRAVQAFLSVAPPPSGFRWVSSDDDTGNVLYNSQIQTILEKTFANKKLDILGFDACLMSMIETGYAFRKSTELMVASEELEPAAGWNYPSIIKTLTSTPSMSAEELGKSIVSAYRDLYGDTELTTLSVLKLSAIEDAASSLSSLSKAVIDNRKKEYAVIRDVRSQMIAYGKAVGLKTSIDLDLFLQLYKSNTNDKNIKTQVDQVRQSAVRLVAANYASRGSRAYGSRGVSIYFPASKDDFVKDPDGDGYRKQNPKYPVEFVKRPEILWADFIASYFQ